MLTQSKIIRELFQDDRNGLIQLDEQGHLFQTGDNEIIYLDLLMEDFTSDALADKVEEVERLYDEFGKTINLYLICPTNIHVLVREFEIKSKADFCIKIAQTDLDPCNMVLNTIKTKIANNETLGEDDIQALQLLPVMCEPSQRKMMRREVFRIMNIIS